MIWIAILKVAEKKFTLPGERRTAPLHLPKTQIAISFPAHPALFANPQLSPSSLVANTMRRTSNFNSSSRILHAL
jgi:hypothetical protein